jgi:hypothetical protein
MIAQMDILVSEVGPRDGLQSIARIMPTTVKKAWIDAEAAAGVREIEVDRQILNVQQQPVDSYVEQVRDAHHWLGAGAAATGCRQILPLHLTPYIIGLPYRMDAFEALLADLAARPSNWFARGDQHFDIFRSTV